MPLGTAILGVGVALGLLGAFHLFDVSARQKELDAFSADNGGAIGAIATAHGGGLAACDLGGGDDMQTLMKAFLIVERFATPHLPRLLKTAYVRTLVAAGLEPGDWSLGPARIRLSTALAATGAAGWVSSDGAMNPSKAELRKMLFGNCPAYGIGVAILKDIAVSYGRFREVDGEFIRFAAAKYGGKAGAYTTVQAALSAEIYFRLVYGTFQHLRFEALRVPARTARVLSLP